MKKKIFMLFIMAAIAIAAGWNFTESKNEVVLTDLALANVEALANDESESGTGGATCRVRVSCGSDSDFVECSGTTCERESTTFSHWVKCDGTKTEC